MVKNAPTQTELSRMLVVRGVSATPWYAVIDAAQDETSPQRAAAAGLKTQSLYEGEFGRRLDDVAPHLVSLSLKDEFAHWLFEHWGGNHGILIQSTASFAALRRHLRKFLLVKDENGKQYRFRFYDPRALRSFLPACSYAEAKAFFGPVACYYAADRSGQSVLAFHWRSSGMAMSELQPRTPSSNRR